MTSSLQARKRAEEWMDAPDASEADLAASLAFIRRINRFLGYTRATLSHFKRFSRTWKPGERIRIVDLATGSGDIPRALLRWGRLAGFDIEAVAVDLHDKTIATARSLGEDEHPTYVRGDARHLPFADGEFDYAITAMFIHHLDENDTVAVMKEMNRVARRGVVVADLLRDARALRWIKLFTVFSHPMVKHDAVVSVEQAYTQAEITRLRDEAGLVYARYFKHFGHRFALAGERNG